MAKGFQNTHSFNDIIKDVKKRNLQPVYILMGEEPYYLDKIVEAMEKYVIPDEDKDFNFSTLYGADTSMETVVTSAQQYPFMSDRRLVILKEAQSMERPKEKLDKLEGYVSRPNPQTTLVVVFKGDTLNATSKLIKAAKKSGAIIFNSEKVKEGYLSGPIRSYCQSKKVGIDDAAVDMLAAYVGNSLGKLFGEIDKLIIALQEGDARINIRMVEENIGISKEFNNFELISAISRRDYPRAMRIVDYFSSNPRQNPVVVTLGMVFNYFANICIAHFNADKSDQALMGALKMRSPYQLREIKNGMRTYNAAQSVKIISAIRETDRQSKGVDSAQDGHQLLRELIFRIFTI